MLRLMRCRSVASGPRGRSSDAGSCPRLTLKEALVEGYAGWSCRRATGPGSPRCARRAREDLFTGSLGRAATMRASPSPNHGLDEELEWRRIAFK
jgi:hypothetical protein